MKGYAKRDPGRYSYGAGLWLHIGKTGLSKWKFRSRSNDTDTTIDLGTANSHNNERWARSQIEASRRWAANWFWYFRAGNYGLGRIKIKN